jgi:Flp pilus assembly pilin Flp
MLERIRSFASDQSGATSIESAAALIAVAFIAGVAWLSVNTDELFDALLSVIAK